MNKLDVQVTLTIMEGPDTGKSIRLMKQRTTVGRKDSDIVLNDRKISSQHMAFEVQGLRVFVEDLASRNGVFRNGKQVATVELKNLDEIQIGTTKIRVLILEDLEAFKTRNLLSSSIDEDSATKRRDIASMIDDELKRFSKWDLSSPAHEVVTGRGVFKHVAGLEVLEGSDAGRKIRVEKETTILGRGKVDVSFRDADISRQHAEIVINSSGQARIRDLGSTNGTHLNGKKVTEAKLANNDRIQIGGTIIRFISGEETP